MTLLLRLSTSHVLLRGKAIVFVVLSVNQCRFQAFALRLALEMLGEVSIVRKCGH
jgi:hypothetical protein